MIEVIIELELVYPYKKSFNTLLDFNNIWNCNMLGGGTNRKKAKIAMPSKTFKQIFGSNPKVAKYDIPSNSEHFLQSIKVVKINCD